MGEAEGPLQDEIRSGAPANGWEIFARGDLQREGQVQEAVLAHGYLGGGRARV